jgi:hypothetical protein
MKRESVWALTKPTIVTDLTLLLNSPVSDQTIGWLVSRVYSGLWSEDSAIKGKSGKYEGCSLWSKAAKDRWLELNRVPIGEIIHEHIVPRNLLAKKLLALRKNKPVEKTDVENILNNECFACIVLKTENKKLSQKKMPFEAASIWSRYEVVPDIVVGKIHDKNPATWQLHRESR